MITREDIEQLKAFARVDGLITGGLWIISFACFVGEFNYPALGIVSILTALTSIIIVGMRVRRYRDSVLDGIISTKRAYAYCFLIFAYSSLLMAAAQYIYFQFIDQGYIISMYSAMTDTAEFKALMAAYKISNEELQAAINSFSDLRPIDIAFQFFTTNIIIGTIISLPIAMLTRQAAKRQ
ncbi:MAG: DUF4199 domain-containing protein [Prevotella sp.]